jgi:uracil phosphoribosyltransferase
MSSSLPPNVHVSEHPCIRAKLSQLRSKSSSSKEVKSLVHEISLILSVEALAKFATAAEGPKDQTPLGFEYTTTQIAPDAISIVPILRSGLGMVEGVQTILPNAVPVHHLGIYREPSTLDPVEYYNNLSSSMPSAASGLAIIVDPVIATGGTCAAAIQSLREWGARKILVMAVLGAEDGVRHVAQEWPEGTELWLAGVDKETTPEGMLKPGLGDVGDRLFLTLGK